MLVIKNFVGFCFLFYLVKNYIGLIMNKLINAQFIFILFLFILSCKEEPTKPQTEPNLALEVLDKSCTQVQADV